jgi:peroxiredoxin
MSAVLILAIALACGKRDQSAAVPAATRALTPLARTLEVGALAPDVTFRLADGFSLSLAALRGKVVAVIFCNTIDAPGCISESRGLAQRWGELEEKYVTAIGVVPSDSRQDRPLQGGELRFEFATDVDGRIARAFGVTAGDANDPTVFFVARDGSIRAVWYTPDPEMHVRGLLSDAR